MCADARKRLASLASSEQRAPAPPVGPTRVCLADRDLVFQDLRLVAANGSLPVRRSAGLMEDGTVRAWGAGMGPIPDRGTTNPPPLVPRRTAAPTQKIPERDLDSEREHRARAVDEDFVAGDEGSVDEIDDGLRDVFGGSDAAERDSLPDLFELLGAHVLGW